MTTSQSAITIFRARTILTMNPSQPQASHVAVREGRILGVGDAQSLQGWGEAVLDERYAHCVLMPGLVEGHCHLPEGGMWMYAYVGYYDRRGPDGRLWKGATSYEAVCDRLREAMDALPDNKILLGWGFDPIYFTGSRRMSVHDLDTVSDSRPVVVLHASLHLMNVNSVMLAQVGIDRDCDVEGVMRFDDGEPTGELCEMSAMFPVMRMIDNPFKIGMTEKGVQMFGQVAQLAGVTTATDLVNDLDQQGLENLQQATRQKDFPVRIIAAAASMMFAGGSKSCLERLQQIKNCASDKLRFGIVKLVVDGSIQGFTARLRWPGYYNGAENGIWVISPETLEQLVMDFHAAGAQLHIHTNGDEATEVSINALEKALQRYPRPDHRHTLQHCQMADAAQFRRMAKLGICVNLFANHLYYWGDAHYEQTMGPDRANRMDACGTALRLGLPMAIHSDAPITPLAPMFTAWCAVNRVTASGRKLCAAESISVEQALYAITLGAAYTLHMDHEIGSIETGKWADFCVMQDNPLEMPPEALKDARILGTIIGGVPLAQTGD